MAGSIEYGDLPFEEAIEFFRRKTNVPTARWNDLWHEQHDAGFMVAGAMKADLLADLRAAVDKAISQGTTLETFRQDFDVIVAKHGWAYNGTRNWRTDVILNTNIRTSYMAGRFQQMSDPDTLADRPYWEYRHGDSINARAEHLAWHGKVLRADDPWWQTHYPPNGWGCKCKVFALSDPDLQELGKSGPDPAPEVITGTKVDRKTGVVYEVPDGVDLGFAYTPGRAYNAAQVFAERIGKLPTDLGALTMREQLDTALPYLSKDFAGWMDEVARAGYRAKGEHRVIGALSPRVVAHLEAAGHAPASAAVIVTDKDVLHMLRDAKQAAKKSVAQASLRHLPRILGKPVAVLWDKRDPGLLYVFDPPAGDRKAKIVVKVNLETKVTEGGKRAKQPLNRVRTAGLVPGLSLQDAGLYEVIEGAL